ncbi:zonular occludens toxin domain-containing protein [Comamonas sp. AG1104]|uniref:zonular occludens toxin domain-containing protein n=1 Tax=Comamonas sp. AG1104 TaxID=2183900 RepID=UPI000E0C4361|nr:zonular occludens toxin domain-containing protein [Comamonas sp. AG1104]RDI14220.1 zona occludens toxin [Comamonas sp. AG1104]
MMTLFTGNPGAGKTASMIDLVMRELGNRPVFVHFDEAERIRPEQTLLAESLKIPHTRCNARNWFDEVPDGAVLLIDEAQGPFRPRGSGSAVPKAVQAFETHRHAGIDVFMTTQGPRLVDSNLRALFGRHVHIRDKGWMGRWWYEWTECNTELNWKKCENKRRYKLPKRVFDFYKSANEHTKAPRKIPPVLFLAVGAALICAYMLFSAFYKPAPEAKKLPTLEHSQNVSGAAGSAAVPGQTSPAPKVYDFGEFIPRVSSRPETSPAYDEIRKVVVMAVVAGGLCKRGECTCFTQQGTHAGLTHQECKDWMEKRPFDPYTVPSPPPLQPSNPVQQVKQEDGPQSVPMPAAPAKRPGEVTINEVTRAARTGRLNELGTL